MNVGARRGRGNVRAGSRTGRAFSLLEAAVAVGIAGFCLIAMLGLLPVGLRNNQSSIQQAAAGSALFAVVSDIFATPVDPSATAAGKSVSSLQFKIPIPATSPSDSAVAPLATLYFVGDGRWTPALQPNSQYKLTVTPVANRTGLRKTVLLNLRVTWPAAAVSTNTVGSVETFVALNRN